MTKAAIHDARIHLYNIIMSFLQVEVYEVLVTLRQIRNLVANTLPSPNNIEMFLT